MKNVRNRIVSNRNKKKSLNALEKEEERSDFETIGRLYYEMRKRDNNELDRKELLSSMNQKVHGNEGSRNQ